ncbi:DHCW motif cupin fold protein [Sedimentitalea todarodis]|uniref:DHCW motif cupin fold protein n=1 Tax=Sedimentitalea todarodis TaxID=1631240 RepID=A0ABU3VE03_9RHOB|nr:DHCW motif cupin fold protein [Sedimentitalea todarodis]MDU9004414.1 DHCW motif cupin fold protein [Sedimentitalea todarodis]
MNLPDTPFTTLDWNAIPSEEYPGTTGTSRWRSFSSGDLRVRMVDYGPGYLADHWCDRGHVLHVISGELVVELADGREIPISQGSSFCVSNHGDAAHRVRTSQGCSVFIVD